MNVSKEQKKVRFTFKGCSWGAKSLSLFRHLSIKVNLPVLPVACAKAYTTSCNFSKKIYELNCFTTQKNRVKWHDTVFKNHVKKSYYNICERTDNLNFGGFFVCFDFPKFDPSTADFYQNSLRFVNKINFWRENRENITFLS